MDRQGHGDTADGEERAWRLVLRCARASRMSGQGNCPAPLALGLHDAGEIPLAADDPGAAVVRDARGMWRRCGAVTGAPADLLDLYLPLCRAALVIGHLGQSLDGYVATSSGDSAYVNDPCNIVHLHRLRALCDAVVVGGATVRDDDPRLTVRHVPGTNPTRVIIDPRLELDPSLRVFTDGAAPTLVASTREALARRGEPPGQAGAIVIASDRGARPDLGELLAELRRRGCHRIFVEGGGVTVTRFLQAGLLDRLQVAVAPFFIGRGRRGIDVPGSHALADCVRPPHRVFRMGSDVLFDMDLRASPGEASARGCPESQTRAD